MNPFAKKGKSLALYIGIFPALFLFAIFTLIPSFFNIMFSFTNVRGILGVPWHFIGLENYKEFFIRTDHARILLYLKNTFLFTFVVSFVQNIIAMAMAIILNSKLKGTNFYRSVIFMPVVLGVTITGLAWSFVLNPLDGPIAQILRNFGIDYMFLSSNTAIWWVIFIQIWMCMGYSMIINLAALQAIPGELYESGYLDGTTLWTEFRNITLPLVWNTVTLNIFISLMGSLNVINIFYVTTKGNFNTKTLPYYIYEVAYGTNDISGSLRQGYGSAVGMMMFFITLVITLGSKYIMDKRAVEV